MTEEPIKQTLRRIKKKVRLQLDQESFRVYEATGKAEREWDFTCLDNTCWRHVKVFYKHIPRDTFLKLVKYNKSPRSSNDHIQIQFIVYDDYQRTPIVNPKLNYNDPEQDFPDELMKLVK